MARRTTEDAVKGILNKDYGPLPDGSLPSLIPYIDTASSVVDDAEQCASDYGEAWPSGKAELIERWLAAHFYTKMDPTYSSRTTGRASGQFIRDPQVPEPYKDGAQMLDPTGCVSAILNRKMIRGGWLGKPPSDQTTAEQRGW